MRIPLHRRRNSGGQVMIEFCFTTLVSVPLILGVLAIGIRYIREMTVGQMSRDLANMYVRNVDFLAAGAPALIQRLGPGFDFSAGGNGVVIFSRVRRVTHDECEGAGIPAGSCNTNQIVFEQQIVHGNPSIRPSNFGTVPEGLLDALKMTTKDAQRTNPATVARKLGDILDLQGVQIRPRADGSGTFTVGAQTGHMVEVIANTTDLNIPGFMPQTQVYSRSIF